MDFTREPVIETIIASKEGYRLVIRSSKNMNQEEYFVDAVEVITFGNACFFRSKEKPKPFLVPVSDYEVVEVREQRLVLKTKPFEESATKVQKGKGAFKEPRSEEKRESVSEEKSVEPEREERKDNRLERKRERRSRFRKEQRTSKAAPESMPQEAVVAKVEEQPVEAPKTELPLPPQIGEEVPLFRTILPPPTTLIRDDLHRLRETASGAFYTRKEDECVQQKVNETKEVLSSEGGFQVSEKLQEQGLNNPAQGNELG